MSAHEHVHEDGGDNGGIYNAYDALPRRRESIDDLDDVDEAASRWAERAREAIRLGGRILREIGRTLACFDEWPEDGPQAPRPSEIPLRPRHERSVILPATPRRISFVKEGHWIDVVIDNKSDPMIPPGGMCEISGQPQLVMRLEQLHWISDDATKFRIHDAKVGHNSQLANSGTISAELFARPDPPALFCDIAQVSMNVSVMVENISDAPVRPPHVAITGMLVE